MDQTCPVLPPALRAYGAAHDRIEQVMMETIAAALETATLEARSAADRAGLDLPPPSMDYFTSVAHQKLFCLLCKADPETFAGGDADIARVVLRNGHDLSSRWSGRSEAKPRP